MLYDYGLNSNQVPINISRNKFEAKVSSFRLFISN